jgi:hypothetical protein
MLPNFQKFGSQMAARLSALRAGRILPPGRFLVLISVRGWVDRRAMVRLEGLGKLKNKSTPSGTRTGDLRPCSTVPQPTTPPRAPCETKYVYNVLGDLYFTGAEQPVSFPSLPDLTAANSWPTRFAEETILTLLTLHEGLRCSISGRSRDFLSTTSRPSL